MLDLLNETWILNPAWGCKLWLYIVHVKCHYNENGINYAEHVSNQAEYSTITLLSVFLIYQKHSAAYSYNELLKFKKKLHITLANFVQQAWMQFEE